MGKSGKERGKQHRRHEDPVGEGLLGEQLLALNLGPLPQQFDVEEFVAEFVAVYGKNENGYDDLEAMGQERGLSDEQRSAAMKQLHRVRKAQREAAEEAAAALRREAQPAIEKAVRELVEAGVTETNEVVAVCNRYGIEAYVAEVEELVWDALAEMEETEVDGEEDEAEAAFAEQKEDTMSENTPEEVKDAEVSLPEYTAVEVAQAAEVVASEPVAAPAAEVPKHQNASPKGSVLGFLPKATPKPKAKKQQHRPERLLSDAEELMLYIESGAIPDGITFALMCGNDVTMRFVQRGVQFQTEEERREASFSINHAGKVSELAEYLASEDAKAAGLSVPESFIEELRVRAESINDARGIRNRNDREDALASVCFDFRSEELKSFVEAKRAEMKEVVRDRVAELRAQKRQPAAPKPAKAAPAPVVVAAVEAPAAQAVVAEATPAVTEAAPAPAEVVEVAASNVVEPVEPEVEATPLVVETEGTTEATEAPAAQVVAAEVIEETAVPETEAAPSAVEVDGETAVAEEQPSAEVAPVVEVVEVVASVVTEPVAAHAEAVEVTATDVETESPKVEAAPSAAEAEGTTGAVTTVAETHTEETTDALDLNAHIEAEQIPPTGITNAEPAGEAEGTPVAAVEEGAPAGASETTASSEEAEVVEAEIVDETAVPENVVPIAEAARPKGKWLKWVRVAAAACALLSVGYLLGGGQQFLQQTQTAAETAKAADAPAAETPVLTVATPAAEAPDAAQQPVAPAQAAKPVGTPIEMPQFAVDDVANAVTFAWLGSAADNKGWEIPLELVVACQDGEKLQALCASYFFSMGNTGRKVAGLLVDANDPDRLAYFLGCETQEELTETLKVSAGVTSTTLKTASGKERVLLTIPFQQNWKANPGLDWERVGVAFGMWVDSLGAEKLPNIFPTVASVERTSAAQKALYTLFPLAVDSELPAELGVVAAKAVAN